MKSFEYVSYFLTFTSFPIPLFLKTTYDGLNNYSLLIISLASFWKGDKLTLYVLLINKDNYNWFRNALQNY